MDAPPLQYIPAVHKIKKIQSLLLSLLLRPAASKLALVRPMVSKKLDSSESRYQQTHIWTVSIS